MQMIKESFSEQKPLILLVDDQSIELELNKIAINEKCPEAVVKSFECGSEILEFIRITDLSQYLSTLMILDLKMPTLDGFDIIEIMLDEDLKKFPVVLLSSSSLPEDIIRSKQLGADDYLEKPIGYKANLDLFEELLSTYLPKRNRVRKRVA